MATPEKAVLDYLYFRTPFDQHDFSEWRLNVAEYHARISEDAMRSYLERFRSPTLLRRYRQLQECLNHA